MVATRDRPGLLAGALAALGAAMGAGEELIVVDSASRDPEVRRVAEMAGAKVLRCDRPGTSHARNVGLAATTAPIVAFTDDDGRPRPGWTQAVAAPFADPRVGFVVGRVLDAAPEGAEGARRASLSVLDDPEPSRFRAPTDPMTIGHGANMAFRRDALVEVGGFDETLGPGARFCAAEDQDAFWRVLDAGWQGVYEPGSVVVHEQWRGLVASLALEYRYGVGSGAMSAKIWKRCRPVGRRMLTTRLWSRGVASAAHDLRRGHERAAAATALRACGVAVGALGASRNEKAPRSALGRPG